MNTARTEKIKERLTTTFQPEHLEVIDDSHQHIGHSGNQTGAGHFTVKIKADIFRKNKLLENHRLIYDTLNDMMHIDIHALSIQIIP